MLVFEKMILKFVKYSIINYVNMYYIISRQNNWFFEIKIFTNIHYCVIMYRNEKLKEAYILVEVLIDIFPKADKLEEVKALILHQCEYALKNHTGCYVFVPSMSLIDNRSFYIKEKWYTTRDLVNYRNSVVFKEYNEKLKLLIEYDNVIESFERI